MSQSLHSFLDDGAIPESAGVEVHGEIPGWIEIAPGAWQNDLGGVAYGRYFQVTDPSQWGDLSVCFQDGDGVWFCREDAFNPTPPAIVPEPVTLVILPDLEPVTAISDPPAEVWRPTVADTITPPAVTVPTTTTATQAAAAPDGPNWWWLLLLLLLLPKTQTK